MGEPMTDERLAQIREQADEDQHTDPELTHLWEACQEIDRLRASLAATEKELSQLRDFADAVTHWRERRLSLPAAFDSFERALRDAYERLGAEDTYRPCSHEIERDSARAERDALVEALPRCESDECNRTALNQDGEYCYWCDECREIVDEPTNTLGFRDLPWAPIVRSLAGKGGAK